MATKLFHLRLDEDVLARFERIQSGRGDAAQFIQRCMDEYVALWGDQPTPNEVTEQAIANVLAHYPR